MFDKYFVKIINASTGVEMPIPNKYISLASYVSTPHQRQDLDSFQDDEGRLHRNTLTHTRSKLEWNTPPLYEKDLIKLQDILNSGIINEKERKSKTIARATQAKPIYKKPVPRPKPARNHEAFLSCLVFL